MYGSREEITQQDQSDGSLARQALHGNEAAFETLVKRYSSLLFHFIYHLLGDYESASDVLQLVMVQLYVSLPTLHRETSFRSWLFTVAHNQSITELRKKRPLPFSALAPVDEDETELVLVLDPKPLPPEILEHQELQELLQRSINRLPIHYRRVILLRYAWQLTFSEIGAMIGIPEATAKTQFRRGKHLLRAILQAEYLSE